MTEYIAATRKTIERSRRTVGAVALGVLMFGGSATSAFSAATPAFSAQEELSQVQTLEASAGVTKTGKMQKTEVLERAVILTRAGEGFWL